MPGFPSTIPNRKTLEEFIVNFLWINIIHSASNYAMAPDFIPIASPKLYEAMPNTPALTPNQIFMSGKHSAVILISTIPALLLSMNNYKSKNNLLYS